MAQVQGDLAHWIDDAPRWQIREISTSQLRAGAATVVSDLAKGRADAIKAASATPEPTGTTTAATTPPQTTTPTTPATTGTTISSSSTSLVGYCQLGICAPDYQSWLKKYQKAVRTTPCNGPHDHPQCVTNGQGCVADCP
jgi:hypothetical protein